MIEHSRRDNDFSDVEQLLRKMAETDDSSERERLRMESVERALPLADNLARRYFHSSEPPDDLCQVARMGLVKAVNGFVAERGCTFLSYAIPTIRGELRRHFRDRGWAIRVPRRLQEAWLKVRAVQDGLTQRLGRTPTVSDLAAETRLSHGDIREACKADELYQLTSLNRLSYGPESTAEIVDGLGRVDPNLDALEARLTVLTMMGSLSARKRRIIYLRYFKNLTQVDIAKDVGVSQMQVSRLIEQAVRDMRSEWGRVPAEVGADGRRG